MKKLNEAFAERLRKQAKKESDRFFNKHIKGTKDLLIIVLKTHLFTEILLDKIMKLSISKPNTLIKGYRFVQKIDLLEAKGTLSDNTISRLRGLNDIRNHYGHDLTYRLTHKDLGKLTAGLYRSKNVRERLMSGLGFLIGNLEAVLTMYQALPFILLTIANEKLVAGDPTYIKTKREIVKQIENIKAFIDYLTLG